MVIPDQAIHEVFLPNLGSGSASSLTGSFLYIMESFVLCWLRRTDKKNTPGDKGAEDRDKTLPRKYLYGKQASHKS